ncbi:hypothetical protein C8R43DRAFT_1166227 [Mycena crocata]|nr:hypothetical protein C8R43DRAFT_1166227 [Mycena crocata]
MKSFQNSFVAAIALATFSISNAVPLAGKPSASFSAFPTASASPTCVCPSFSATGFHGFPSASASGFPSFPSASGSFAFPSGSGFPSFPSGTASGFPSFPSAIVLPRFGPEPIVNLDRT